MGFIVNNTTFPTIMDLIFPHSCRGCGALGSPLCNRCKNNIILESVNFCPNCKALNPTGKCPKCKMMPPTFMIGNRTDLIGKLIYDLKFNSVRALARPIAEILDNSLPNIDGPVVVVPLPTIRCHIRQRGLDHTYLIAKNFVKIRGVKYSAAKILQRTNSTVQVGADRKARLAQASSAYNIGPKYTLDAENTYIIFDDIWTTGASIKAAVRLLKSAGARKIIVALLAVSRIDQK